MKKLEAVVAQVLGLKEGQINDQTSPENVASWDSFNGLMLVSELENNFGIKFTMDEITTVKKVGEIRLALKKHGVNLEE